MSSYSFTDLNTSFGATVRSISDAQIRSLMRAVFYREQRYQHFCLAPLSIRGALAWRGAALVQTVTVVRLLEGLETHLTISERDFLLAAALLQYVGAGDAYTSRGSLAQTSVGRLYPLASLSALIVHDAPSHISAAKRQVIEGLILQSERTLTGANEETMDGGQTHLTELLTLCTRLARFASLHGGAQHNSLQWSSAPQGAHLIELSEHTRKDHHDTAAQSNTAAG